MTRRKYDRKDNKVRCIITGKILHEGNAVCIDHADVYILKQGTKIKERLHNDN